jgi:HAD superfamily hydrolase (TIGR01456 family)
MALSRLSKFVVLDIDGVLLKGGTVIDGAARAVQRLAEHKIPYVFVTNGGGVKESKKAEDLTKKLGINVGSSQVIMSHTPFMNLTDKYADSKVLVVGGYPHCLEAAQSYGFTHACSIHCYHAETPKVYPLRNAHADQSPSSKPTEPVEAVMIFHDPVDWGLEMQILCDVLSPAKLEDTRLATEENKARGHIPFYVSNADIVYTTEYPHPRFTQGAFVEAFRHLYELYYKQPLVVDYCGKPYKVQYEFATQQLREEAGRVSGGSDGQAPSSGVDELNQQGSGSREVFFGVGDNPKSDIRGANSAGPQWRSVLVRTGIFSDAAAANDATDPARFVCDDIVAAVQTIIDYSEDE